MNAYLRKLQLLLALSLGLMAGQDALAWCDVGVLQLTPTMRVDGSAAVGTVMYNETWNSTISVHCDDSTKVDNVGRGTAYESTPHFLRNIAAISDHSYVATIDFTGLTKSIVNHEVVYVFPPGVFTRLFNVTVNLQYVKGTQPVSSSIWPFESASDRRLTAFWRTAGGSNNGVGSLSGFIDLTTAPKVSRATCSISSQTVPMTGAPLSSFAGVGSVSSTGAKDFDVPLACSNVTAGLRVGLSFSTSDQDPSLAAGVIKTDQGAGNAAGIGLQIVNRTSNLPIKFGQFEPGVAKTGDGTYHNIYRVQYFQTRANPTTGPVTGRTTVTVAYQ